MSKSLYDFCVETGKLDLLAQWNTEKNEGLTAKDITHGSHKRVWWTCEKGHEWQVRAKDRFDGKSCPICANRSVLAGFNDLATTHPDIAAQWHPEKNKPLTAQDVVTGKHLKVWWQCEKGHEWQASVLSRTSGKTGCPACTGKMVIPGENDLQSQFPAIATQWHPTLNGNLTPDGVTPCSNRPIWWICEKGHAFRAAAADRTSKERGCPYCSNRRVLPGFNDLETTKPQIAAQWHPTLNGSLTAQMVTSGSSKRVWWQCQDGHVWKSVIYSRTAERSAGCPVCAGKVPSSVGFDPK